MKASNPYPEIARRPIIVHHTKRFVVSSLKQRSMSFETDDGKLSLKPFS
jgi:hypothetical protein